MTTQPATPDSAAPRSDVAQLWPLIAEDPPKVGDFWLDARLAASPSGIAYVGHDDNETPVMLVLLSAGAAADAAARDRLAGTVNKMHIDTVIARGGHGQDEGRLGHRFRPEDDDPTAPEDMPLAPWVALAYDGSTRAVAEAYRILAEVDMSELSNQGNESGPDYRHYWLEQGQPGRWRLWPLPWPGRHDRAGWLSILASWFLMMLLMLLALVIAILLFQDTPPQSPPPPVPTSASGSSSSSPGPSDSASPQSASPQSGTPSASGGQTSGSKL